MHTAFLFTPQPENHLQPCTYSYGKPLNAFIFTVLDDLIQLMVVMGLSISHNYHDFFNPSSGTPGFSESFFPEIITDKRAANKTPAQG